MQGQSLELCFYELVVSFAYILFTRCCVFLHNVTDQQLVALIYQHCAIEESEEQDCWEVKIDVNNTQNKIYKKTPFE